MRVTFYSLFSVGFTLLLVYLGVPFVLSAMTSPVGDDWLVDGRYVTLTLSRYQPGSVTHFDFKELKPSRNAGFYLLVGSERVVAVHDRPGCPLEYRRAADDLYNPCTQRAYPVEEVLAGTAVGDDLVYLPTERDGGELTIDVRGILYSSIR